MVRRFAEAGVERLMLQDFLPWDLDMVDLMAAELIGKVLPPGAGAGAGVGDIPRPAPGATPPDEARPPNP
jgi:hypothetical protein